MSDVRPSACLDPETMAAFIDGRLDARAHGRVETHLAECEDCYERFAETDALVNPPAAEARRPRHWPLVALAAAATIFLGVCVTYWRWESSPRQRISSAVAELAEANRTVRFSSGQLSVDRRWAAAPSVTRGAGPRDEPSLDVRAAVVSIEKASATQTGWEALHALGLAHLASGDLTDAVTSFQDAVNLAGAIGPSSIQADLAAALIDEYHADGDVADLTRALDSADNALRQSPGNAAALFDRALALEGIGPKNLAIDAWQTYIAHEQRPQWIAEARGHLQNLTSDAPSLGGKTTSLFHTIDDRLLPDWLADVQHGRAPDTVQMAKAQAELAADSPDMELRDLVATLMRVRGGAAAHCAEDAVAGLLQWKAAYEMLDTNRGQRAAAREASGLGCLGLSTVGAQISSALLADRDGVYTRLEGLSRTAERTGLLRKAALADISLGNTELRRADPSTGIATLERASSLAVTARDLELAATAEAMLGDAYQDDGDDALAWSHLRRALGWLDGVTSPRLYYSIVRACADEARLEDRPAASLTFSALLLNPGTSWKYPGALAYARMERADALLRIGAMQDAAGELRAAAARIPGMPPGPIRDELENELETSQGHLDSILRPAKALSPLSDAIAYFGTHDTTFRLAGVLLDRGRAEQALGHPTAAARDWKQGAAIIEDQQPAVRDEQLRISRLSSLWDVYSDLIGEELSDPAQALETAEHARSRELLDSIAHDQPLGRFAPLAGSDLWSWLPDDTTALVFCVLPQKVIRWTVRAGGVTETQLPLAETRLGVLVHLAVAGLQRNDPAAARDLGRVLLERVALPSTTKRLLIVPDGALDYAPFAALSLPGDRRFLVEHWTLVTAPSLSVARALSTAVPNATGQVLLAGYGNAAKGLPALPGVNGELRELRSVYPDAMVLSGASATPEAVLADARHSSVIHIAAHAVINGEFPSRSAFVLAPGTAADGAMLPAAIASTELTNHPVVVLSACDTATGEVYRGEGAMSLARPFLAAGASGVIATLWPIPDATAPLVRAIHVHLRDQSPALALALAQRDAVRTQMPIETWAAWISYGGT